MKKLTFFGAILVCSLVFGLVAATFISSSEAATGCSTNPNRVYVGECTQKCQPGYTGYLYETYQGYWNNAYIPCGFLGMYCECRKDVEIDSPPTPEI